MSLLRWGYKRLWLLSFWGAGEGILSLWLFSCSCLLATWQETEGGLWPIASEKIEAFGPMTLEELISATNPVSEHGSRSCPAELSDETEDPGPTPPLQPREICWGRGPRQQTPGMGVRNTWVLRPRFISNLPCGPGLVPCLLWLSISSSVKM